MKNMDGFETVPLEKIRWHCDPEIFGIEILTGVEAGKKRNQLEYEPGTVNFLVNEKLQPFADLWKNFK